MNEDAILSSLRWSESEGKRRDLIVGGVETVLTTGIALMAGAGLFRMLMTMFGA